MKSLVLLGLLTGRPTHSPRHTSNKCQLPLISYLSHLLTILSSFLIPRHQKNKNHPCSTSNLSSNFSTVLCPDQRCFENFSQKWFNRKQNSTLCTDTSSTPTQIRPRIPSHGSQPRSQESHRIILGWQVITERTPRRRKASPWRALENTERSRHRHHSQQ